MGKVPVYLRKNVAKNIRDCRFRKYPHWGGSKKCAEDFGVSPQQRSQWERGVHMPDEFRMMDIAAFFGVSTEYLRRDNSASHSAQSALGNHYDDSLRIGADRERRNGWDDKDQLVRVEVERIPCLHSYLTLVPAWRELTITFERQMPT